MYGPSSATFHASAEQSDVDVDAFGASGVATPSGAPTTSPESPHVPLRSTPTIGTFDAVEEQTGAPMSPAQIWLPFLGTIEPWVAVSETIRASTEEASPWFG